MDGVFLIFANVFRSKDGRYNDRERSPQFRQMSNIDRHTSSGKPERKNFDQSGGNYYYYNYFLIIFFYYQIVGINPATYNQSLEAHHLKISGAARVAQHGVWNRQPPGGLQVLHRPVVPWDNIPAINLDLGVLLLQA